MSVFDKLISGLHFNNSQEDDGYDDGDGDFNGYEDDEPLDDQPRRRGLFGRRDNEENDPPEENNYVEDRPERPQPAPQRPVMTRQPVPTRPSNMVPVRRGQNSGSNMQVRIIKPSTFDQASEITDTLLSHRTVLLNLEGLDVNTAQRIVDFASGSCYALHGNFMKISHFIIVITPEDVDIAGDIDSNGGLMGVLNGASTGNTAAGNRASANTSYGNPSYNTGNAGASYGYNAGYTPNAQQGYQGGYGQNSYANG